MKQNKNNKKEEDDDFGPSFVFNSMYEKYQQFIKSKENSNSKQNDNLV